MKYIFMFVPSILAIASAHHSEEERMKVRQHYQACVTSSGVDKDLIINARKGEFHEDDKLMSYYFCMMHKLGFQDEDGTLHPEVMVATMPENSDTEKATTIIEKCTTNKTVIGKEWLAYNVMKCIGRDVKFFN